MFYIVCSGLLLVLVVWVGLRNTEIDLRKNLSTHIGKSHQSIWVARICFIAASVLLLAWFTTQYVRAHHVPVDVVIGIVFFAAMTAIQGIFPYGQNKRWNKIHDASSWTAACLGPVLLLRFASISYGPTQYQLFVCGLLSVVILASLLLIPPARRYFLILQLSMVMISGASFLILSL